VLKRLHDAVPATPFNEVKRLVEKELGAPLAKNFSSFEESVLASASIGQVHVANLLDGTKCVVKAQHPNVEQKILQDLKNMETIVSWIELLEPDLEAKHLVQEWTREVSKELEFDKEAENMFDVGRNLASDPTVYAALPMPIKGLYTKRVLVMHFVPGAKVNDLDNLRRVSGVDTEQQRSNLAMDICNAFARQLFVDGIFQA
jgi:ubiquinone biosynthesis protein